MRVTDPEPVNKTATTNDPIIAQGMHNKKRILEDYQKIGKDSNDSIAARKKGKISDDIP